MSEAPHKPVLIEEVLQALDAGPGKLIVDGTFGAGGYSRAILATGAEVLAIDRDPSTERFAQAMQGERFRWMQGRFSEMERLLAETGRGQADGVALDLGVSSMQLDQAERGFSFMRDGPLDMRMGAEGRTAADLVNEAAEAELARIFSMLRSNSGVDFTHYKRPTIRRRLQRLQRLQRRLRHPQHLRRQLRPAPRLRQRRLRRHHRPRVGLGHLPLRPPRRTCPLRRRLVRPHLHCDGLDRNRFEFCRVSAGQWHFALDHECVARGPRPVVGHDDGEHEPIRRVAGPVLADRRQR